MSVAILELVVKVSLLLTTAAIVTALMQRRTSAALRHLVWTLTAVGALALPVGSVVLPRFSVPIYQAAALASDPVELSSASQAGSREAAALAVKEERSVREGTDVRAQPNWGQLALVVYALGVVLLLARLAGEQWKAHRLLAGSIAMSDAGWLNLLDSCAARMGVGQSPRLLSTRAHAMPAACGACKPTIVIPSAAETWSHNRRRAVLLHELAHVARFDCLTQTLAEIVLLLYWPHPGVWWMAHRLRVERELACDDRVLECDTEPDEYAGHLLDLAYAMGPSRPPALVVSMAHPRQLEGRMLAVLDETRKRSVPTASRRVMAWGAGLTVIFILAAATGEVVPFELHAQSAPPSTASARNTASVSLPPGTWQLRQSADGRSVQMIVSERENSSHGATLPVASFDGLAPALAGGGRGPSSFSLKRDAGTFAFEGVLRAGAGGGTVTFAPSTTFPVEMVHRGFARPTVVQQAVMAASDVGFAFIDELAAQKYARPNLEQLINAAQHGVGLTYVKEFAELGYRLGTVDALVRQHDHGISPQYVRDLRSQGFGRLSADDLVRTHDHGVGPDYVSGLRTLGFTGLSLDALITAHDHGISVDYVRNMRTLGYQLSLEELTSAHDHGVGPEYVGDLRTLGYTRLSLDNLIDLHDHGVDRQYVEGLAGFGYGRLPVTDLVRLHDHGVTAGWLRTVTSRSASRLSVDDLVALHDRGETGAGHISKVLQRLDLFERDLKSCSLGCGNTTGCGQRVT